MKSLEIGIKKYVALKRAYGLRFDGGATVLEKFSDFCKMNKYKRISIKITLEWIQSFPDASQNNLARKMMILRGFASYWKAFDKETEVFPKEFLRYQKIRNNPHIYSPKEIKKILAATRKLGSERGQSNPIRPQTFYTMFGLIASTGLRRNEAINLKRKHVDFDNGTLLIEMTKFRKSRLIPIHPSTLKKLKSYARFRDAAILHPKCENFFIMNRGQPVDGDSIYYAFVHSCQLAGIRPTADGTGYPRIHDLRHTFVVRAILGWLQEKKDVHSMMPVLSSYVGHAEPSDTYWYLTGVQELLQYGLYEVKR